MIFGGRVFGRVPNRGNGLFRSGKTGGGWHFIHPNVFVEKKPVADLDVSSLRVCAGCRYYQEMIDRKDGVTFVYKRWCHKAKSEVSNLGKMTSCPYKEMKR